MEEVISIQWFPGHMTRTKRQLAASLKLVDCVAEIIDLVFRLVAEILI